MCAVWRETHDAIHFDLVLAPHGPCVFQQEVRYYVWVCLIDGPTDEGYSEEMSALLAAES